MRMKFGFFVAFSALFIILSAASVSYSQITGGYGDADVTDKEVIKAANFAVKKRSQKQRSTITLISINKAQIQVVAGLNYELCLEVSIKKSGKKTIKQFIKTVIYRNLNDRYSLTNWDSQESPQCGK